MNNQIFILHVGLFFLFSISTLTTKGNNLDSLYQAAKLTYLNDVDKALELTQQVIDGARYSKDSIKLWQGLRQKGRILQKTGDFTIATSNFQAALVIVKAIKDNCGIGQIQTSLSYLYMQKRTFGDGLMFADSAIDIFKKDCPNDLALGKALINKGSILLELENYQEAKKSYQMAKSLVINQDILTLINENLAIVYYYEDNYEKAKNIYLDNYKIYEQLKDISSLAQVSNSLGAAFYELNNFEKARDYFKRSVSFSKQINNNLFLTHALINLGYLEMELGHVKAAENYRLKVDEIIVKSGGLEEKLRLAEQSVEIYDYKEMYEAKSDAQEQVLLYTDSLHKIANQELIAEKLAALNIAEAEARNITQKFYIATLAAILFLSCSIFFYLNNKSKEEKRKLRAKIKEEEALTREKILDTSFQIKQEIHKKLHDRVSNPLSTAAIYIESFSDNPSKIEDLTIASKIVEEAYDISRSIAHELLPYKIDWVDRINLVLGALERSKGILSKIKFNRKGINRTTFSPEKGEKVAAIIGNLLVNVEKHAEAKQVQVNIEKQTNSIQIIIEDDGIGFDANQQTGIGLLSIRSNIKALDGTLNLASIKGSGTKAIILIPIA